MCLNLTHFYLSPPLLSLHAGCRETGALPRRLPVPVPQYRRTRCRGLWLYSTMDQHETNPFNRLLVKLLFVAQFLKSRWWIWDSWKGLLGGTEFQKPLTSLPARAQDFVLETPKTGTQKSQLLFITSLKFETKP